MGYLQEAAQRAATLIRQVLSGSSQAPRTQENVTPLRTNRAERDGRAQPQSNTRESMRDLARGFVRQNHALFAELFHDRNSGRILASVPGKTLDQVFTAGKGRNLSPQAFRMAVVGCGIGSCPNDGIVLTPSGMEILSEELGRPSAAAH